MTTTDTPDPTTEAIYAVLSAQQTTAGTVDAHQLAADIAAALPTMPDPTSPPPDPTGELIVTGFDTGNTGEPPVPPAGGVQSNDPNADH